MPQKYAVHDTMAGFTLVEMAIVLVVIGLMVGGILVGRDLIKAAEVRATVAQIDKLKAAILTFKIKYNLIPGDADPTIASALGIVGSGGVVASYYNNGFIDSFNNEGAWDAFYQDLVLTKLLACTCAPSGTLVLPFDKMMLPTKLARGAFFVYGGLDPWLGTNPPATTLSFNYIEIFPALPSQDQYVLTPYEAYAIDVKVDDGLPMTGIARAQRNALELGGWPSVYSPAVRTPDQAPGGAGVDVCVSTSTTPSQYNVQNTNNLCTLQVRAGF